jgi:hypothetical protein
VRVRVPLVGAPCVAQRVCAMPIVESGRLPLPTSFSSSTILPTALRVSSSPPSAMTVKPAES